MDYDVTIHCKSKEERYKVLAGAQRILPFSKFGEPEGWNFERSEGEGLVLKTKNQAVAMLTSRFEELDVRTEMVA